MSVDTWKAGETIAYALDASAADLSGFGLPIVKMQRMANAATGYEADGEPAIDFTVTARAAVGAVPAGWNARLSAAESLTLEDGRYVIDAALPLGTDWVITPDIFIVIKGSVSRHD